MLMSGVMEEVTMKRVTVGDLAAADKIFTVIPMAGMK
jgi:hypothetical protein